MSNPLSGNGTPPAGGATPPPATPPVPTPPPGVPAAIPPASAAGATPTPSPGDQSLGPAGQRALEAEREQNAELRRQLAAATAGQTDQQRTEAALAQMQQELATERQERLRLTAANSYGVPATHLHWLTATDAAGLETQARGLAEMLTAAAAGQAAAAAAAGGIPPATPPGAAPAAPLPGQGTPAAPPATSTVAAGRDLYKQRNTTT